MRLLLFASLFVLFAGCSPTEPSAFGSRLVDAACVAGTAPWLVAGPLPDPVPAGGRPLRAATYNIHSGLGAERAVRRSRTEVEANLRGIARAIAESSEEAPDLIALNEVDLASRRSGGFDQAFFLAHELERLTGARYTVVHGQTWSRRLPGFEVRFGNAALVRHGVLEARACSYDNPAACGVETPAPLPALHAGGLLHGFMHENRGVIRLTLDFHGRPLDVLVTHLDAFSLSDREVQAAHLVRRFVRPDRTTVLLGDLNAVPTALTRSRTFFAADRTHDILTSGHLADARALLASRLGRTEWGEWATYPADQPVWPLDAALGTLDLVPERVAVIGERESDHRGLAVAYRWVTDSTTLAEQRERHDAIRQRQLAQIVGCDLAGPGTHAGKIAWLVAGTGFLDIATAAERQLLMRAARPL